MAQGTYRMIRIVQLDHFLCTFLICSENWTFVSLRPLKTIFFHNYRPTTLNGFDYLISPSATKTALPNVCPSIVNPKRAGVALVSTPIFSTSNAWTTK